MKRIALLAILVAVWHTTFAGKLFIPMDTTQTNHLRAYGIVYHAIAEGKKAEWLLNYRGGSFMLDYSYAIYAACRRAGVAAAEMGDNTYTEIVARVMARGNNGDVIPLTRAPKMAVYTPGGKKPWDDAVTLALTYAGIPFDKIYVDEVLAGSLSKYDWLHLHHEDFTGQYGKFWGQYRDAAWYQAEQNAATKLATKHGFAKVWQMQQAVVRRIQAFIGQGGNLFAMCSATDTYDIAIAADGIDICDAPFDGDAMDPDAQNKLKFEQCLAFTGFKLSVTAMEYEYSSIDNTVARLSLPEEQDVFTLYTFQARKEAVPSMLCQNHVAVIKGFQGQTTAYRRQYLKPGVVIMGAAVGQDEARYIHGRYRKGTWTFYGGHDPEDYQHKVQDPPTDLSDHPNSPGYRLILNNVLCIASGRQKQPEGFTAGMATGAPVSFQIAAGGSENTLVISGGSTRITEVAFVNDAGKEVLVKQFDTTNATIDVQQLPAGRYNIRVNGQLAGKIARD